MGRRDGLRMASAYDLELLAQDSLRLCMVSKGNCLLISQCEEDDAGVIRVHIPKGLPRVTYLPMCLAW